MLMGFRPFIELIAVPFWGNVAERWRRWKTVLLFSLFCWLAFTLSLAFIQPDAHSCLVGHVEGNKTIVVLAEVYSFIVGPIPWGHSGTLCHALSLLSLSSSLLLLLWTSILHCHSPGVATVARRLRYSYAGGVRRDTSVTW